LVRTATQRLAPGSLILLYHRIVEREHDPWSLCVSPRNFAEHLEVVRGRVRPLAELAPTQSRERAAGNVVITFDDGYADVFLTARPLLERYDAPATAFVTTGGVDGASPFWWDELDGLLLTPRTLPRTLELQVRGTVRHFALDEDTHASPGAGLYRELHALLGDLDYAERSRQLTALRAWAGVPRPTGPADRVLMRDEIAELAANPIFEIGAHTVSHSRLPALAPSAQQSEICESRTFLEALIGRPVSSFAYPHGLHSATTRRILREAKFARSCTTTLGIARRFTDPFRLPRVEAPDCDGENFARFLRRLGFSF
jgi:peptidoglycan/xylan/chitin deacetylase (PgdA/CDA1 family)